MVYVSIFIIVYCNFIWFKKNYFNFLVKLWVKNKESECMYVFYLRFFVKCLVFYFLKGSLLWDFFLFFL